MLMDLHVAGVLVLAARGAHLVLSHRHTIALEQKMCMMRPLTVCLVQSSV